MMSILFGISVKLRASVEYIILLFGDKTVPGKSTGTEPVAIMACLNSNPDISASLSLTVVEFSKKAVPLISCTPRVEQCSSRFAPIFSMT